MSIPHAKNLQKASHSPPMAIAGPCGRVYSLKFPVFGLKEGLGHGLRLGLWREGVRVGVRVGGRQGCQERQDAKLASLQEAEAEDGTC